VTGADLLATLQALELESHRPEVRADIGRLAGLLHPEFFEIGPAGRTYSRAEVLAEFAACAPGYRVWAQGFHLQLITESCALLTYLAGHLLADGSRQHHTSRTSLWQRTGQLWQLRFHQGTPTSEFHRGGS